MSTPKAYLSQFSDFTATLNQGNHVPSPIGNGADISALLEQERQKYSQLSLRSQSLIGEADFAIKDLQRDNAALSKSLEGTEIKLTAAEKAVEDASLKLREAIDANLAETATLKKEKSDLEIALLAAQNEAKEAKEKLELAEAAKTTLEADKAQLTTDLEEAKRLNTQQGAANLGLPTPAATVPGQAPVAAGATTQQGEQTPATMTMTPEQIAAAAGGDPEVAHTLKLKETIGEFRRRASHFNSTGGRAAKKALDDFRVENETLIFQAQSRGY